MKRRPYVALVLILFTLTLTVGCGGSTTAPAVVEGNADDVYIEPGDSE